jgi:hypothetical protein
MLMEHDSIGDYLSFNEIARAWFKVVPKTAGDNPDTLMEALVRASWRGEFERDVDEHFELFTLSKPDSASRDGQRRPGDYAISGGAIVKVSGDGESNITAERKLFRITRERIARLFYTPRGRRGITQWEPAEFEGWSFDKRDLAYPNWRAEYDEVYRALSTVPYEQWPTTPVDMRDHCEQWCIRRRDFARWYRASPLSAGAPLERFWPHIDNSGTGAPENRRARPTNKRRKKAYRSDRIGDAFNAMVAAGRKPDDLLALGPMEFMKQLSQKIPDPLPHITTVGRWLRRRARERTSAKADGR